MIHSFLYDSTCQSLHNHILQERTTIKGIVKWTVDAGERLRNWEYTSDMIISIVGSQEVWVTVLEHVCKVFEFSLHNNSM